MCRFFQAGEVTADGKVVGAAHLEADDSLLGSGMASTLLRPTTFASNTLWWRDAEALLSDRYDGRTLTLTGPELLSVPDQVRILGRVLGRSIGIVDGELAGLPEQVVTGSTWVRDGHNAIVTTDVPEILDRPATPFATWADDNRAAFRRSHLA